MSTDNYVKYISEQINKEKVRGFTDITISEGLNLTSEDYIDMLHMYIEDLESHFEAEDLQQIQELSQDTMKSYAAKAAVSRKKAQGSARSQLDKADSAHKKVLPSYLDKHNQSPHLATGARNPNFKYDRKKEMAARYDADKDSSVAKHLTKFHKADKTSDKRTAGLQMAAKKINEESKPFHKMSADEKEHHISGLVDKAYEGQHAEIKSRYGKKAADEANYGHGESVRSDHSTIGTKVYGRNKEYLSTHIDHHTGEISHDFH